MYLCYITIKLNISLEKKNGETDTSPFSKITFKFNFTHTRFRQGKLKHMLVKKYHLNVGKTGLYCNDQLFLLDL